MSHMWEVKGKRDSDGWCGPSGKWCGYCNICSYMYKNRGKHQKDLSLDEWRKWNFKKELEIEREEKKKVQAVRDAVMFDATGGDFGGLGIKHTWWTIALPSDYCLKKMQDKTKKLMETDLYGMGKSVAVYENHSEGSPNGGNLHVHILVPEHGATIRAKKQIEMVAKHYGVAWNFVDRVYGRRSMFKEYINYIKGAKVAHKMEWVNLDKEWRRMQELPDIACRMDDKFCEIFGIKYGDY